MRYNTKQQTYKYNISDDELVELLKKLPNEYLSNYSDWFIITTILKNLDKYKFGMTGAKKMQNMMNKEITSYGDGMGFPILMLILLQVS